LLTGRIPKPSARVSYLQRIAAYEQADAVDYAKFFSRSHDAVIRVYNDGGNVIETHEHAGDFNEW
jgi:hypothetical protein